MSDGTSVTREAVGTFRKVSEVSIRKMTSQVSSSARKAVIREIFHKDSLKNTKEILADSEETNTTDVYLQEDESYDEDEEYDEQYDDERYDEDEDYEDEQQSNK